MIIGEKRSLNSLYRAWRKAVVLRDKNKCQWPDCSVKRKLEVHHIVKYADCPELRNAVGNGICLCKKHHHKIKGKEEFYIDMFMTILRYKAT